MARPRSARSLLAVVLLAATALSCPPAAAREAGAGRPGTSGAQYRGAGSCSMYASGTTGRFGARCRTTTRSVSDPAELLRGSRVPPCWLLPWRLRGGDPTPEGFRPLPSDEPPRLVPVLPPVPPVPTVPVPPPGNGSGPAVPGAGVPGAVAPAAVATALPTAAPTPALPPAAPAVPVPAPLPVPTPTMSPEPPEVYWRVCVTGFTADGHQDGDVQYVDSSETVVWDAGHTVFWWDLEPGQQDFLDLVDEEGRILEEPTLDISPTQLPRVRQDVAFSVGDDAPEEVRRGTLTMRAVEERLDVDPGEPGRAAVSCTGRGRAPRAGEEPGTTGREVCWFRYRRSSVGEPGRDFAADATVTWRIEYRIGAGPWQLFTTITRSQPTGVAVTEVQTLVVP
ncbi:hypothetical protein NUM3379_10400 [Kineococcus sp. NUM-3379]